MPLAIEYGLHISIRSAGLASLPQSCCVRSRGSSPLVYRPTGEVSLVRSFFTGTGTWPECYVVDSEVAELDGTDSPRC